MNVRWIKVFRDIWSNKARTILVILSIAVGIFAVGTTLNAQKMVERDMNEPFAASNPASTTLYITPFDIDLAHAVEAMREIGQAEPRREETIQVYQSDDEWMDLKLTVVPDWDQVRINQFSIESGQNTPGSREILLERKTAAYLGVGIGDVVTIKLPNGDRSFNLKVTGLTHDMHQIPIDFFEQGAGYVSMDTLQWMGLGDYYNVLNLVMAEKPADKEHILSVMAMVRDRVIEPSGYEVAGVKPFEGEPRSHAYSGMISAVLIILVVIGVMCILLSAGLVINTISAQIARQTKQIGIMRSIGAPSRDLALMYITSIIVFCVLALIVAVPLGVFGARGLVNMIADLMNFDTTGATLPLSVVLIQVGVGLLVPIGAGIVPILSGTSMTIYQAINQDGNIDSVQRGIGERILQKFKGVSSPVILAVRNTFRRKARLVFTLVTLTLAGATFMAAFSTRESLSSMIVSRGRYFNFDVQVYLSGDQSIYTVEREALRLPEVQIVEAWYGANARVIFRDRSESEEINIQAVPVDSVTMKPLLLAGRWLQPDDTNAIVVNEKTLEKVPGLKVGDVIMLRVEGAERELDREYEVVGVASYGADNFVSYDTFTRSNGAQNLANLVRVRVDPNGFQDKKAQETLGDHLEETFDDLGWETSGSDTRYDQVDSNVSNFDILLIVLLLMSGLLALVGGMGLAGTMSLNVLERTREIGVLRAVGGTNASVRRVVLFEGAFVGLLSWLLSSAIGVPFGYLLTEAVAVATLEAQADYLFSMFGLVLWLVLVLVIAAIASLIPANRASKLTIREVLSYE